MKKLLIFLIIPPVLLCYHFWDWNLNWSISKINYFSYYSLISWMHGFLIRLLHTGIWFLLYIECDMYIYGLLVSIVLINSDGMVVLYEAVNHPGHYWNPWFGILINTRIIIYNYESMNIFAFDNQQSHSYYLI